MLVKLANMCITLCFMLCALGAMSFVGLLTAVHDPGLPRWCAWIGLVWCAAGAWTAPSLLIKEEH